jgi:hypothetical protein
MHHIIPVSVNPELECEENNIVRLCRLHHFRIGHLGNWNLFNPNVVQNIAQIKIITKQYE